MLLLNEEEVELQSSIRKLLQRFSRHLIRLQFPSTLHQAGGSVAVWCRWCSTRMWWCHTTAVLHTHTISCEAGHTVLSTLSLFLRLSLSLSLTLWGEQWPDANACASWFGAMNCGVARTWPSGKWETGGVDGSGGGADGGDADGADGADGPLGEQTGCSSVSLLVLLKPLIRDVFAKRLIETPGRLKEIHQ